MEGLRPVNVHSTADLEEISRLCEEQRATGSLAALLCPELHIDMTLMVTALGKNGCCIPPPHRIWSLRTDAADHPVRRRIVLTSLVWKAPVLALEA